MLEEVIKGDAEAIDKPRQIVNQATGEGSTRMTASLTRYQRTTRRYVGIAFYKASFARAFLLTLAEIVPARGLT